MPREGATPPPLDTAPRVVFGGFVDGYYAWDVNRPYNFDRAYTTQPARHANFNINLAFIEARLGGPRYRGRLAVQFGSSVQANYAAEPRVGTVSGAAVSQFLQEATVGYQLGSKLWLDGGIFFAHTGYEGWISRDNLTYTRSLMAEFSPYYAAGVKLTWTPVPALTAQIDVINGWQNISNYNSVPAVGVRADYAVTPRLTLSYDNFFGNAAADSVPARLRLYHEIILQYAPSESWQIAAVYDVGTQSGSTAEGATATWTGSSLLAKYRATSQVAVVARLETFADPSQVIAATGLPHPFAALGGSVGVDVAPVPRVLWRTELRGFRSHDAVWPTHDRRTYGATDAFAVTSLALTF